MRKINFLLGLTLLAGAGAFALVSQDGPSLKLAPGLDPAQLTKSLEESATLSGRKAVKSKKGPARIAGDYVTGGSYSSVDYCDYFVIYPDQDSPFTEYEYDEAGEGMEVAVIPGGSRVNLEVAVINYFPEYVVNVFEAGSRYQIKFTLTADKDCVYTGTLASMDVSSDGAINGFNSVGAEFVTYDLKAGVPQEVVFEAEIEPLNYITSYPYPTLYSYFIPTETGTNLRMGNMDINVYEGAAYGWNSKTWFDHWTLPEIDAPMGSEGSELEVVDGVVTATLSMTQEDVDAGNYAYVTFPLSGLSLSADGCYMMSMNVASEDYNIYSVELLNGADSDVQVAGVRNLATNISNSTSYILPFVCDMDVTNPYLKISLQTADTTSVTIRDIAIKSDKIDLSNLPVTNYDEELGMWTVTTDEGDIIALDGFGSTECSVAAIISSAETVTLPAYVNHLGNGYNVNRIEIYDDKWAGSPFLKTLNAPDVKYVTAWMTADTPVETINVHRLSEVYLYDTENLPEDRVLVVHSDLPGYGSNGSFSTNVDYETPNARILVANETLDAPNKERYEAAFWEQDEFGAWIGFNIDGDMESPAMWNIMANNVYTDGTKARIPEYVEFPGHVVRYAVSSISNSYEFTNFAQNLSDLYISGNIQNIQLYWHNTNIRNIHFYGEFQNVSPTLNSNLNRDYTVYFPSQEWLEYFQNNADYRWTNASFVPEGWEYPALVINVERRGEFAQTLLELTDFDWSVARNVKVTGRLNENDLKNMKEMTNLEKLDLSEADFDALPSNWLSNINTLRTVILPEYLTEISEYAFSNCYHLTDVNIENITTIGNSAFSNCSSLSAAEISNVTYIGNNAFQGCSSINEVTFSKDLKYLGRYSFNGTSLTQVVIPEGIAKIDSYVFSGCRNLNYVELPSTLRTIASYAFNNTNLIEIIVPEGVTSIEYNAFASCRGLKRAVFPSTLTQIGGSILSDCSILREVICKAVVPPSADGIFTSGVDLTHCTLYVAPFAIDAYRADQFWGTFYIVKPLLEAVSSIVIDRPMSFDLLSEDNEVLAGNPSMLLKYLTNSSKVGQLSAEGDGTLSAGYFEMWSMLQRRTQRYSSYYAATLINNAENMRADDVNLSFEVEKDYWHFFSLPYDVEMANVTANEGTDFVIRRYDSEKRALGDNTAGSNWIPVGADETLVAGQGYIIQAANNTTNNNGSTNKAYVRFRSGNTLTKNNIFRQGNYIADLKEYPAEFAQNRSWNFIGNPYPSFYRLNTLLDDFYQPVTIWRGTSYQAYSPIDDDVVLRPFEAFFVQCPLDNAQMTFAADGRMHYTEATSSPMGNATPGYLAPAVGASSRSVFNFTVSGQNTDDRARLVINEEALRGYEISRDAAKMFADVSEGVEVYVNDGALYAICERPLEEGHATLGVKTAVEGEYTISLDTKAADWKVILTDNLTGAEVDLTAAPYVFDAAAGDNASRFTISLVNTADGIGSIIGDDADVVIYTLQGLRIHEGLLRDFNGDKGIYVVVCGDRSFKVEL